MRSPPSDVRTAALWALDGVVAAGMAVASVLAVDQLAGRPTALSYVLVLGHTLPVAVRRRWPLAVLTIFVVTGALLRQTGVPPFVPGPLILLPIYSVAATYGLRTSLAALAAAEAALLVQGLDAGGTLSWGLILGGAWLLGHYARTRRLYTAALELRAQQLEDARHELAQRAVAEERLRIARELHDVVAHAMSLIAVQSGVGAHVIDSQPEEARKALAAIEEASRGALDEMRRLLGVLRDDSDKAMPLAPAPGLGDVGPLVERVIEAGIDVRLTDDGADVPLPAGVDLAAYRIVQEALTNVVKHASARHAQVDIHRSDSEVSIEVRDDGVGAAANGRGAGSGEAGHGIAGMRERAALYGGSVDVGPRPGGGFSVLARLPLKRAT